MMQRFLGVRRVLGLPMRRWASHVPQPHRPSASSSPSHAAMRALPMEEFGQRAAQMLRSFGRRSKSDEVVALLADALRRCASLSHRVFRDCVLLGAHSRLAQPQRLAVQLYLLRAETHLRDVQFSLMDSLVDAAFDLREPSLLEDVAKIAADKLIAVPDDHPTDIALTRTLWRLFCLERLAPAAAEDARRAATAVWGHMLRCNPALAGRVEAAGSVAHRDATFEALRRAVAYGGAAGSGRPAAGDDLGECAALAAARRFGLLRCDRCVNADGGDGGVRPLQLHLALLRSCRSGLWVEAAGAYYAAYRAERPLAPPDEVIVFAYLGVLHAAKQHKRVADVGASLLTDAAYSVSAPVIAMVAEAAGEAGDGAVAQQCLDRILQLGDAADVTPPSGESAPARPSQFNVFQVLTAVAKLGRPSFPSLVERCTAEGRIEGSADAQRQLLLQWGLYCEAPTIIVDAILAPLVDSSGAIEAAIEASDLSERALNQLLRLLQRADHPALLAWHRYAVEGRGFGRPQWVELLVVWADRRRYALSREERAYVLRQADAARGLDRLGPMVALLRLDHDTAHAAAHQTPAQRHALSDHGGPHFDPRAYFLRRGPAFGRPVDMPSLPQTASGVPAGQYQPLTGCLTPFPRSAARHDELLFQQLARTSIRRLQGDDH